MKKLFEKIINKNCEYAECPEFMPMGEYKGIRAITYDGAELNGKKTKIFAYMGFPEDVSGKTPAIVLVHGGGGAPYLKWIKQWNDRGYAAIAMSNTGYFPTAVNAGADETEEDSKLWEYGLSGIFSEEGYTSAPNNDSMQNSESPIDEQWIYHAISSVIIANTILVNEPRVDAEKIGIMGISWGGVITSLAIGYDKRFAFAIPVYGSGYLANGMGYIGNYFRSGKNPELWLAEKYFPEVNIPILWQCWNSDKPFSVNSCSKSYVDTARNNGKTRLSIIHQMNHAHLWSWIRKEPVNFADFVCKKGAALPTVIMTEKGAELVNPDNLPLKAINLYYITEPLGYVINPETKEYSMAHKWNVMEYDGEIPVNARGFYVEATVLVNGEEVVLTSEFFER